MSGRKRRRLDNTVAAIQQRYGAQALQRGARTLRPARGPHISTGFPTLDAVTGCDGVPGNAMTLLCGQSTSGKLTVAYKTLAAAQQHGRGGQVAIVDLAHHSDPDYLARCGIDLARLLLVRHHAGLDVPALLVDLVRTREVRLILLDNVSDLLAERGMAGRFNATLGPLTQALRTTACGLLLVDELQPPWQRWLTGGALLNRRRSLQQSVALHIVIRRERWLREAGVLVGYRAQARVERSRWRHDQPDASVEIRFNGAVRAQGTW